MAQLFKIAVRFFYFQLNLIYSFWQLSFVRFFDRFLKFFHSFCVSFSIINLVIIMLCICFSLIIYVYAKQLTLDHSIARRTI